MNLVPTHKIEGFRGINNVQDPDKLQPNRDDGTVFLTKADHTDITDDFRVARRSGSESVYTGNATVHSMFATPELCLFVEGTALKSIDENFNTSVLLNSLIPNRRMSYVDIGGVIYFSNGFDKGYIMDGVAFAYTSPADTFKIQMPAGHLLDYYNGRLYVASNNLLFVSDPYHLMQYDERTGIIPFEYRITTLKHVSDGLWVGTEKSIIFLAGGSPADFRYLDKANYGAVENSAVTTSASDVGMEADGDVVIMASTKGLCVCAAGGIFRCTTGDYYVLTDEVQRSSAFFKKEEDKHQYLLFNEVYTVGHAARIATDFPFPDSDLSDNPMQLPTLVVSFTGTFQ